MTKIYEIC